MTTKDLLMRMDEAFAEVPQPAREAITRCECWECVEVRDDFSQSDPKQMDSDRMAKHDWDFILLTPAAKQYFLPGWIRLAIEEPSTFRSPLLLSLASEEGWDISELYTYEQRQVVMEWLQYFDSDGAAFEQEEVEQAMKLWSGQE